MSQPIKRDSLDFNMLFPESSDEPGWPEHMKQPRAAPSSPGLPPMSNYGTASVPSHKPYLSQMFGLASRQPPPPVSAHPSLAPVKIPNCPKSPISHPELAFSPTDMGCGLWERRNDKRTDGAGANNVSTGPTGGRGWFY